MKPALRALASLKLTVVLILMIAVALSAGTIIESLHGAEAARAVYYAPWFFGLQGLFALNIVMALWERWPRDRWRIGFVITHVSMLLILGGALMTAAFKIEGRLPLWEGQSADWIYRGESEETAVKYKLPFALRLDAFEMDFYPGTMRPAMFRSRVTVIGAPGGAGGAAMPERRAVIEMNRPLSYGGFQFFQSSYQQEGGREMSILSVSKDPGEPVVFFGYGLLVFGMLVVLTTRIAQRREAGRSKGGGTIRLAGGKGHAAAWIALIGAALAATVPPGARAATAAPAVAMAAGRVPSSDMVEALRRLPVQSDGRVMPLDTQARDDVRTVTAAREWKGMDPVAMVVGWTTDPQGWLDEPVVRIDGDDVASLAGLPAGTHYASYRALASSRALLQAISLSRHREEAGHKPWSFDKHMLQVEERLGTLDRYLGGEAIRAIPAADARGAWHPPTDVTTPESWAALGARIRPTAPAYYPSVAAIEREIRYNQVNPVRVAWILLLPAAIAAGLTLSRGRRWLAWIAAFGTLLGFAVMTWGIATRWQIAGRIPASNMYESMLFLAWGVGLFGVVSLVFRNRMLVFNATAMSALVVLLLDRLPIDPFIHPMPPVLSGTPWLAIHVPIIMVSYSVFAIATFLAHVVLGVFVFAPGRRDLAERWSDLLYWYLIVGSILLIAGIMTGSIWAASSWGRYWGWDPKEVWSLVAFLAYMAILHARFDGQIRSLGVAVSSIAAFWTILMTYLGVNFVLASGLHSYGFGSSNLVFVMGIIALVEVAFVAAGWLAHRNARSDPRRPIQG
ncbi:MAG TPA: cytochrome c biogenesis protein CcsA [Candidatus Eisenbacteria bacterium]